MDKNTVALALKNPATRRQFFSAAGMTTGLVLAGQVAGVAQVGTSAKLPSFPFTLGVASGDPTADGIVLWTRLAPNPDNGPWDSSRARAVQYQVALDANFRALVRQGTVLAIAQEAHSVHVEVSGLMPGATYYYRFLVDGYVSRTGRCKTAPAANNTAQVKFAFCSCSDFQNGFFAAYREMANEDIDFWVHLGDYLYEYDARAGAVGGRTHSATDFQKANGGTGRDQLFTLNDYRNRYAQYRQEAALQTLHASHALIAVWDDHETENNYGADRDEIGDRLAAPGVTFQDPATFLLERAAAYQAWYEHMPVRRAFIVRDNAGAPVWKDANLYRRLQFGDLMTLHMLDTRQYRTDQPREFGTAQDGGLAQIKNFLAAQDFALSPPATGNPTGTLLGATQRTWLTDGLTASPTEWNVIGQQVMMSLTNFNADPAVVIPGFPLHLPTFNIDQWDGYATERNALLSTAASLAAGGKNPNVVVLTGDIHSAWANDLKIGFTPTQWGDSSNAAVATEFVCSSITADFPAAFWEAAEKGQAFQPWNKYIDPRRRGYVRCTVTQGAFRADFRSVMSDPATGQVTSGTAAVSTTASFQTTDGVPGAVPV